MKKLVVGLLVSCLCVSFAASGAQAGKLTFGKVKYPVNRGGLTVKLSSFAKSADAKGLSWANATVAKVGGIAVAFDSSVPNAKKPNQLKIDFTGKGDFTNAQTVNISVSEDKRFKRNQYRFPRAVRINPTINGQKADIIFTGRHYGNALKLLFSWSLQGKVKFGNTELNVNVNDKNGNLKFDDQVKPNMKRPWEMRYCDNVIVHLSKSHKIQTFCNGLVLVKGKWYKLSFKDFSLTAKPYAGKLGKLKVNAPWFRMQLVSEKTVLSIYNFSNAREVQVPPGKYMISFYETRQSTNPKQPGPGVAGRIAGSFAKIKADQTTTIKTSNNINITLHVRKHYKDKKKLIFSLGLTDEIGGRGLAIMAKNGRLVPAPKIEVYDEKGKKLATISMKYG